MTEREEAFFTKAEKALESLNKIKAWYKNAVIAFTVTILIGVSGGGIVGYKIGLMEKNINLMATKKSVGLLRISNDAVIGGLQYLVDDRYEEGVTFFLEQKKIIDDNIWMFTSDLRGGKK